MITPSGSISARGGNAAHAVVAAVHVFAEKLQDAEPHGGIGVEEAEELAAGNETRLDAGAGGGRAVVAAPRHHVAHAEDLPPAGDARRLGVAVAGGGDKIDM